LILLYVVFVLVKQVPEVLCLGLTFLLVMSLTPVELWPSQILWALTCFSNCFCRISCIVEPLPDSLGSPFWLPWRFFLFFF
jgi:hypothetical protein